VKEDGFYGPDKKEIGKDTIPGPDCEAKFMLAKDRKLKLLVRNLGPVGPYRAVLFGPMKCLEASRGMRELVSNYSHGAQRVPVLAARTSYLEKP
jgi:hypothetical protein